MHKRDGANRFKSRQARVALGVVVVSALVMVALALGSCGGSGETVAEVDGQKISKATLDHWVPIEAVISREVYPERPPPSGVIPDPPSYSACVGYTKSIRASGVEAPDPSTQSLSPKAECKQRYAALRKHMLQILITYQWLIAESAAQGVKVSDAEVRQNLERYEREQFGSKAKFRRFLKYTHQTVADELLVIRIDQLSTRLQKKILAERGKAGAIEYYKRFPEVWTAKTDCRAGYVIPECKQYRGPEAPEASI
jgi:hypothetical protein